MHVGLILVALGAAGLLWGAWGYVDPRAARTFRWLIETRYWKFGLGPAAPAMLVLNGAGVLVVGVALWIGRNTVTLTMVWIGCLVIAIGVLLYAFSPAWAQPPWARSKID